MIISIPEELKILAEFFHKAGHELYVVGGYTRNALLGLPYSDIDVCGAALPEELTKFLPEYVRVIFKAAALGTVELHMGEFKCEYTSLRKESYRKGGAHRPQSVGFGATVEEDAQRRDFTVNALYASCAAGELTDPTGGIADIKNKLIRTTSDDPDEIMRSDGIRVLRLVRFACELGFEIDGQSVEAAKRNAAGLTDISRERIYQELVKIIMADVRYQNCDRGEEGWSPAHYRGFRLLSELGALQYILPELLEGVGVEQAEKYHAYDVFEHSLNSLKEAAPDLAVRFAALFHDIGKPRMVKSTGRMIGHEKLGSDMAEEILARLRAPSQLTERVGVLIAEHMFDLEGKARPMTVRKHFVRLGLAAANQLTLLREADFVGSGKQSRPVATAERFKAIIEQMREKSIPFSENELAISGEDIMSALSIKPGKQVGEIKRRLFMHCVASPKDNNRAALLRLSRRFARELRVSRKEAPQK